MRPRRQPLNERDRDAADDWMRDHSPDPDECSLEDSEDKGNVQSYFFLRCRDSATRDREPTNGAADGNRVSVVVVRVEFRSVLHGQSSIVRDFERSALCLRVARLLFIDHPAGLDGLTLRTRMQKTEKAHL